VAIPSLGEAIALASSALSVFINSLETGVQAVRLIINSASFVLSSAAQALGFDREDSLAQQFEAITESSDALKNSSLDTRVEIDKLIAQLRELDRDGGAAEGGAERLRNFADAARGAAERLSQLRTTGDLVDAFAGFVPGTETPTAAQIEDALADPGEDTSEVVDAFALDLAESISDSVGNALLDAFTGEGFDGARLLADIAGNFLQSALDTALASVTETLTDAFSQIGTLLGGSEGLGSVLGSALVGAIGVGLGILAAELSGTSSSARNDLVRGVTESTQAARGVVAGPTSIPVFQVGQQLEAALVETNGILEEILTVLKQTPGSAGGSAGLGSSAAADLELSTPSLAG